MMIRYFRNIIITLVLLSPMVATAQWAPALTGLYASYRNSQYQPDYTQQVMLPQSYLCDGLQLYDDCRNETPFSGIQLGARGATFGVPGAFGLELPYYQYWNNNPWSNNAAGQTGCFQNTFGTAAFYMPRVPCAWDRYRMQQNTGNSRYRSRSRSSSSSSSGSSGSSRSRSRSSESSSGSNTGGARIVEGGTSTTGTGGSDGSSNPPRPTTGNGNSPTYTVEPVAGEPLLIPTECEVLVKDALRCFSKHEENSQAINQCIVDVESVSGSCQEIVIEASYVHADGGEVVYIDEEGEQQVVGRKEEQEENIRNSCLTILRYNLNRNLSPGDISEGLKCTDYVEEARRLIAAETPKPASDGGDEDGKDGANGGDTPGKTPVPVKTPPVAADDKNKCLSPSEWAKKRTSEGEYCETCGEEKSFVDRLSSLFDIEDDPKYKDKLCGEKNSAYSYYAGVYKNQPEACIENAEDAKLHACIGESIKMGGAVYPKKTGSVYQIDNNNQCKKVSAGGDAFGGSCYSKNVHDKMFETVKMASKCLGISQDTLFSMIHHESRFNLNVLSGDPSTGLMQVTPWPVKALAKNFTSRKMIWKGWSNELQDTCRAYQGHVINMVDQYTKGMESGVSESPTQKDNRSLACNLVRQETSPKNDPNNPLFSDPALKQALIGAAYLSYVSREAVDKQLNLTKKCPEFKDFSKGRDKNSEDFKKFRERIGVMAYNYGESVPVIEFCSYLKYLKASGKNLSSNEVLSLVNSPTLGSERGKKWSSSPVAKSIGAKMKKGETLSFQEYVAKVNRDWDKATMKKAPWNDVITQDRKLKDRSSPRLDYLGEMKKSADLINKGGLNCSAF